MAEKAEKEKETRVAVSLKEKLLLVEQYEKKPAQWDEIIKNIRARKDELPPPAAKLYSEGSSTKLQRRLSDQMRKLVKDDTKSLPADLKEVIDRIFTMNSRYSAAPGTHPTERKEAAAKKLTKRPLQPDDEDVERIIKKHVANVENPHGWDKEEDHREEAINLDADGEEGDAGNIQKNEGDNENGQDQEVEEQGEKRKTDRQLAREAYIAVINGQKRGETLDNKMERCMDRWLKMNLE